MLFDNADITLKKGDEETAKPIQIKGVLPCPVRIPMLEKMEEFKTNHDCSQMAIELQAASMGLSWLADSVRTAENADAIPDLFLSAGFELFFDKDLIGKFRNQNIFEDYTGITEYNSDFKNESIDLKDPDGIYSILGVVPAVFLVNENELNGRTMPTSWEEILSPAWENSVSLPVGDFDLFNAILITIYKIFGTDGIKRLARSFHKALHPSEMVHSYRKQDKPAITIMPYFFSKMARKPMTVVWPQEGAIISPIFMLSKKDKKKELQPLVDFFAGPEIGRIMSHQGRFPAVHPQVDNMLPAGSKFLWAGWDMIHQQDIGTLIKENTRLFEMYQA
ncbi:ABC transporter substrate-binding protein [Clostridiales bacterium COT073_COT-073]|nr:ABC transporter substrate-binding protein [Clostridiales bacterium COT073_COT-073]